MLPSYDIFIHPMHLMEMRKDVWSDEPVPARLTFQKRKYDIDIVYRGSHIREFAKKSYYIRFRKPHLFQGVMEFHLNAEFKDPSIMRNKLSFDFFQEIGVLAPESKHVLLTINGKLQGVYLQLESVDERFLQKRNLPLGCISYAVDDDANFSLMSELDEDVKTTLSAGYELKYGDETSEETLSDFIYHVNMISPQRYEEDIVKYLDVDKYLRWLAGVVCTSNFDGFVHNYALYQNGESKLFEVLPWDYDATWGRDVHGMPMNHEYIRIQGYNTLSARLLHIPAFCQQYKNILDEILTVQYTTIYMKPKIEQLHELIRADVTNDPYMREHMDVFDLEPQFMVAYIEKRHAFLREKLKQWK